MGLEVRYILLDKSNGWERISINMDMLHLDGEANDWWFHGMKALGNAQVSPMKNSQEG